MRNFYFDGLDKDGRLLKNTKVTMDDGYHSMKEIVQAIKNEGFTLFKTKSMNKYMPVNPDLFKERKRKK